MAGVSDFAEKLLLDYIMGGASPTRPTVWAVGLSTASPVASAGSEIAAGSGYARNTLTAGAAASPAGSVSNVNAMSFGPFSTGCTVSGITVWDNMTIANGNLLWYGVLATPRTIGAGDSLTMVQGALVITIT